MDLKRVVRLQRALKAAVEAAEKHKQLTSLQQILIKGLSGAIGAGISNTVLFPFENLKTRLILANDDEKKQGVAKIVKKILKHEGIGGFFVGVKSYVIYSVGTYGIFFLIYEAMK